MKFLHNPQNKQLVLYSLPLFRILHEHEQTWQEKLLTQGRDYIGNSFTFKTSFLYTYIEHDVKGYKVLIHSHSDAGMWQMMWESAAEYTYTWSCRLFTEAYKWALKEYQTQRREYK